MILIDFYVIVSCEDTLKGCDSVDKRIIGMNIKQARKKKKMKQKELADLIGYTESSISKYEQGLIQIPNTVIDLIARALEVAPVDLLGEAWDAENNPDGKLAEEVKVIDLVQKHFGKDAVELLQQFNNLNETGKIKAISDLADMTEIPKYKKEC